VLYVADIGTSTAFYEDALGWRRLTSPPELGTSDRTLLAAAPITSCCSSKSVVSGSRAQGRHLGSTIRLRIGDTDDDLRQIRDRLNALGVPIVGVRTMA